jgi:peptidoglycan/LPS O-acetylase OafA/YrhL
MRLVALDSLRGLCALMVALMHINSISHLFESTFVRQSWLFVDFLLVSADLAHRAVEQPGRRFFNRLAKTYRQWPSTTPAGAALGRDAEPAG